MSVRKSALSAAGLATLAAIGAILSPASARDRSPIVVTQQVVPTALVPYADIDLASAAGERALWSRVTRAVSSVCPLAGQVGNDREVEIMDCRSSARAQARPQVAAAIERSRSGATLSSAATIVVLAGR